MRHFQTLDHLEMDEQTGILSISRKNDDGTHPRLTMRREGGYIAISASYGPLEIALRPRYEDLVRKLGRLRPVPGLQTTRQVGTAEAYLGLGLSESGVLIMRPTIVADATGLLAFNISLPEAIRLTIFEWLEVSPLERD